MRLIYAFIVEEMTGHNGQPQKGLLFFRGVKVMELGASFWNTDWANNFLVLSIWGYLPNIPLDYSLFY